MKVKTSRFGEIEIPDSTLITFPDGMIGFPENKNFVIFDCGEDGVFKWLQSCERPELAFVICDAHLVLADYKIVLGHKETETLGLSNPDDAAVVLIVIIPKNPMDATANLLGPIVMNSATRIGMQLVLVNPAYSTKHRIFKNQGGEERKHAGA